MERALTSLRSNKRTGWHEIAGTGGAKVKFEEPGDSWLVQYGPSVARYSTTQAATRALVLGHHTGIGKRVGMRHSEELIKMETTDSQKMRNAKVAALTSMQRAEYRRLRREGFSFNDAMRRIGG